MKIKTWALITAIFILIQAAVFLIETWWWFWPSDTLHRVMLAWGGVFYCYWGILFFILKNKRYSGKKTRRET